MVLHVIKTSFILLVCFNLNGSFVASHDILVYELKYYSNYIIKEGGEDMTQNTVAYANYLENKRSNLANEKETERSNRAREEYNLMNLTEVVRSNKAEERLTEDRNIETKRSNIAKEKEEKRSNKAQEKLKKQAQKETQRTNKANEKIKRTANNISKTLGNKQIKETIRSNKVNEQIKKVSNTLTKIRDQETKANNIAKIQLEYDKLKQAVQENAKDRANKELIAYINRIGEELASAGFIAMKGNQYKKEISSVVKDTVDKAQPAVKVAKTTPQRLKKGTSQVEKVVNSTLERMGALGKKAAKQMVSFQTLK